MAWFETWFDTPYYHILYKDRDFAEAEKFIRMLVADLALPQESKIIDLACGKGRHSVFLNKLGYEVLGLDLSPQSITHNQQFENANLHFAVHDMRKPIYPDVTSEKQDAVFNLFTSFGYFEDPADDRSVFSSISEVLKSGGYFVLDYLNAEWVRNTLVPVEKVQKEHINFSLHKKIEDNFVIKDIRFEDEGKPYHFYEKVKLHAPETIQRYAEDAGFSFEKAYGDYQLREFSSSSPRCIMVFRKN